MATAGTEVDVERWSGCGRSRCRGTSEVWN